MGFTTFFDGFFGKIFRLNNPEYKDGYQDGFKDCKDEMILELKMLTKKIEKMEAFRTATTTEQIVINIKK